ncbi:30S ribosomal protein S10 [candidate division WWE3 bacterium CG08_land_8_20_14_0_20_40_13]|uniref:Small ribosomal subunit protein uS10 n=1 Tax=candidate division WWE3 bacterium CG08_land_8_20_14_0_20_40_13 TaxID=1975084 RepID=A0A2H0XGS8_UNCKA|nr:MAG: 30S ribosomal protein S10 [candidate division WWE3 bacterium CG08_land_8_20_14_0_20_40_13]
MSKGRIRVKLKSYDSRVVDQSATKIVDTAIRTGAKVSGPVPMPTKRERITVLRGPHIDARSREHFDVRTHVRIIDIDNPTLSTMDQLSHLTLPAGVGIEIKA